MNILLHINILIENIQIIFKSRELAAFIWIVVLLIVFQFSKSIRKSLKQLIKAFFAWKIILIILISSIYITGVIFLLYDLEFWKVSMTKDSILWFFSSAFIVLMSLTNAGKDKWFFRSLLLNNLKLIILFQFIVNVHVFGLITELILLPALSLIVMLKTYSESKKEYQSVENIMNEILIIIGLTFLTFSIIDITSDINKFASYKTLKSFLFPIILSITFIPFSYFVALFMGYEMLFVRLGFFLKKKKDLRYAKWRLLRLCNIKINKLEHFSPKINELYNESTRDDIRRIISNSNC